jgi:uncharacterized circularly permuted ATP-grasp superfamily protein
MIELDSYQTSEFYDEMFEASGRPRPRAEALAQRLTALSEGELVRRQQAADAALLNPTLVKAR